MAFGPLTSYGFTGQLQDANGAPVLNTPIQVIVTDYNNGTNHGNALFLGTTDANGNYSISNMLPNDVNSLTIQASSPVDQNLTKDAVNGTANGTGTATAIGVTKLSSGLSNWITRTVAGRVVNAGGQGIYNVTVSVHVNLSYPGGGTLTVTVTATTDANGYWNASVLVPLGVGGSGGQWSWQSGGAMASGAGLSQKSGGQFDLPFPANVGAYPTVRCTGITMG